MKPVTSELPADALSTRLQGFQRLMPFRIREVLLVSSRYDSFILEEEGQITDLILKEYDRLNLRYAPRLNSTPSAHEALRLLDSDRRFDLIIVTMHPGEMDPADFARQVAERHPSLPVVLLGYDNRELQELLDSPDAAAFHRVVVWTGDARILLAVVNAIEDERNVEHDTTSVGVEVIIFIEDSVHFLSAFLPMLYAELMKQSQRLISEGITMAHKVHRMRARPKVLIASSFEEALAQYTRYRQNLLGVISDVRFLHEGRADDEAGFALASLIRAGEPDVPILLQSTEADNEVRARQEGVNFLHKESPLLKQELERFVLDAFGFGPFIFRLPDGTEVARAQTLMELRKRLKTVPAESLQFHAERNHFSSWLKARTEFSVAAALRPRRISDYENLEAMRESFVRLLDDYRRQRYRDAIAEFSPDTFGGLSKFARIGDGSLGGKARGLAFLNLLLREHDLQPIAPGARVIIPETVVIGTGVFDRFLELNDLVDFAEQTDDDAVVRAAFVKGEFPAEVVTQLRLLLQIMRYPCAVRSSSLLEDSQHQPFAGVYETYMIPNTSARAERRLRELLTAIKLVYASTFSSKAKAYRASTPQRPEKEKMAVIIQKLIGRRHQDRFYPDFAGVAQSYNYYPFGRVEPLDGAASVALGLGVTVVEGREGLRFCPRYPRHLPQFSSTDDILARAQKTFHAVSLTEDFDDPDKRFRSRLYPIDKAIEDETIAPVGSIYSRENHAVYDGLSRPGTPLVTFAGVLKQQLFPLPELLSAIMDLGTTAMSTPVEMEFAVDLDPDDGPPTFACLQMRPLAVPREVSRMNIDAVPAAAQLCRSPRALGNGRIKGIRDVLFVDPESFERRDSAITVAAIAELNAALRAERRPYLLIGPGRWGSADPWLGIPVNWGHISGVRIIVETEVQGVSITPSEGSHFFHNLIAFHVAYMTINTAEGEGTIDWPWLRGQETERTGANGLRWIRLVEPLLGLIDGQTRCGVIAKSEAEVPGPRD